VINSPISELIAKESSLSSCIMINLIFQSPQNVLTRNFNECVSVVQNYLKFLRKLLLLRCDPQGKLTKIKLVPEDTWLAKLVLWKVPVVLCVLINLTHYKQLLEEHKHELFPLLIDLLASTSKSVRDVVKNILLSLL